jgi:arginine decarboxylase
MPTPLIQALRHWTEHSHAPFYTPGHKHGRGMGTEFQELWQTAGLRGDLAELPGLDNLADPDGPIAEAQELAAQTFGADHTRFLINGSTAGIIASILATCSPGDRILLPRNIHKCVIAGLIHSGAVPIYMQPEYNPVLDIAHSVTPATVERSLQLHPAISAVMIVAPTYYGVCGDIAGIAEIVHQYQIPLLVDAAHGAHFGFHPDLPPSALALGADLVVQSTHKLLGAMTQAAMVHIKGDRIDRHRLDRSLQLVQSSSPNYLLMASLDSATAQMATHGKELLDRTLALSDKARAELNTIPDLFTLDFSQPGAGYRYFDPTRLTVTVTDLNLNGYEADELLCQQYKVVAEMPVLRQLTFIISIGNQEWDIEMLVAGFQSLAKHHRGSYPVSLPLCNQISQLTIPVLTPREAFFAKQTTVPIAAAVDRICAELVCPYPPGIPALIPGEIVTRASIDYLQQILSSGGEIVGNSDPNLQSLRIVNQ